MSSLFNIQFTSKNGRKVYLKKIILEDTVEGLEITGINMSPVKIAKPPIKIEILSSDDEDDDEVQNNNGNYELARRSIPAPSVFRTKHENSSNEKISYKTKKENEIKNSLKNEKEISLEDYQKLTSTVPSYSQALKNPAKPIEPLKSNLPTLPKIEAEVVISPISSEKKDTPIEKKKDTFSEKKNDWVVVGEKEKEQQKAKLLAKQQKIEKQLAYMTKQEKKEEDN
jgi:hypothetical protein